MGKFSYTTFLLLLILLQSLAVDRTKFRQCKDTGFCRRYRDVGKPLGNYEKSCPSLSILKQYQLDKESIQASNGEVTGKIFLPLPSGTRYLNLKVVVMETGSLRVRVTEDEPRWQPIDLLNPEALVAASLSVVEKGDSSLPAVVNGIIEPFIPLTYLHDNIVYTLLLYTSPFKLELYAEETLLMTVNERSLLHYEKSRQKDNNNDGTAMEASLTYEQRHGNKEVVDYGEDGLAIYSDGTREERQELSEEDAPSRTLLSTDVNLEGDSVGIENRPGDRFGGHTDTQPFGPSSVGIDVGFPFFQHLYGLPEHSSPLSLPSTRDGSAGLRPRYNEPYRLYNLDVFEYEMDNTMALYGNIPFLLGHGLINQKGISAGLFWFNPSETFVDISDATGKANGPTTHKESHWISESGEVDFFIFPGPSYRHVIGQFTALVGTTQLPPLFSLGYHQCRWNYRDEKDVAKVEGMFEELDFPMDVMWLDIEYTDGKRYFTWDKSAFPTPLKMMEALHGHGRRLVTVIDPHIKIDSNYHIHSEASSKGYYIKTKDGKDFDGWCWPGSSSYVDFTNPAARKWWASQFAPDKYIGSTMDTFIWNDMNEPSVFNGPEVSMNKDCLNIDGIEHRQWHNLYGIYVHMATADGLVMRSPKGPDPSLKQRSFVLSRSFWAGSQKYGAIWTGDNNAEWPQLRITLPMLLSLGLAGLTFSGSDLGGFFHDPSAELMVRWFHAAAFTPFFRNHAHHDSKRREPWVFGEPYTTMMRSITMTRYSLLPFWYLLFYEAYRTGMPTMRTMFMEFPDDPATFDMQTQYMLGSALLVRPVMDEGAQSAVVYLPGSEPWYHFYNLEAVKGGQYITVKTPLDVLPVYIKGGSIIPKKMRLRRSSKLMLHDPYTLVIAPDSMNQAKGELYMDDEISLAHELAHQYVFKEIVFTKNTITSRRKIEKYPLGTKSIQDAVKAASASTYSPSNTVERIVIANQDKAPKLVQAVDVQTDHIERSLTFSYDEKTKVVTIKKPDVKAADDWTITFEY